MVYRIRLGRIYKVERKEYQDKDEWSDPGMLQRISLPLLKESRGFPSLGERLLAIPFMLRLRAYVRSECRGLKFGQSH